MALTIKNLGKGTVGTSFGDVVAAVDTGKSVLLDNVMFVNTHASTTYDVQMEVKRGSIPVIVMNQNIAAGAYYCFSAGITLDAGDSVAAISDGSSVHFLANGVIKDI